MPTRLKGGKNTQNGAFMSMSNFFYFYKRENVSIDMKINKSYKSRASI